MPINTVLSAPFKLMIWFFFVCSLKRNPPRWNSMGIRIWLQISMGHIRLFRRLVLFAYKLELPPSSRIHLVFHVSCLNKVIGTNIRAQTVLPELDREGSIILEPKAILNKRTFQLCSWAITEVLIQWHDMQLEDATWEPLLQIRQQFPPLKLWGRAFSKREGMLGTYVNHSLYLVSILLLDVYAL